MKGKKAVAVKMLVLFILALICLIFIMWLIFHSQEKGSDILETLKTAFV